MPILLSCPRCQRSLSVSSRHAGRVSKCPSCATEFLVPAVSSVPVADPAEVDDTDTEPDPGWASVHGGLGNVWLGTVCLVGAVLVFALVFLFSQGAGGLFVTAVDAEGNEVITEQAAEMTAELVRQLSRLGGGAFALLAALGILLRVIGWLRCCRVPEGTEARLPAFANLGCDLAALAGLGWLMYALFADRRWEAVVERLMALVHAVQGRFTPSFAIPWPAVALMPIAALAGLVCVILFSGRIGQALQSRELPRRVRSYIVWLVLAAVVVGGVVGTRLYLAHALHAKIQAEGFRTAQYSALFEAHRLSYYAVLLIYVLVALVILMKYLGLLGLASDEAQRRAGKWRPG